MSEFTRATKYRETDTKSQLYKDIEAIVKDLVHKTFKLCAEQSQIDGLDVQPYIEALEQLYNLSAYSIDNVPE